MRCDEINLIEVEAGALEIFKISVKNLKRKIYEKNEVKIFGEFFKFIRNFSKPKNR